MSVLLPALLALAGVAAVMNTGMALNAGLRTTFLHGSDPLSAIALRRGALSELVSVLEPDDVAGLRGAPGVSALSPEVFLVVSLDTREGGGRASVTLRGVGEAGYALRETLELVAGRAPIPGRNELVVGVEAQRRYRGLDIGASLPLAGQAWTLVGIIRSGGREDSELWGDRAALQSAYRRGASLQSVRLRLDSPEALPLLQRHVDADPRLPLSVTTHAAYYTGQIAAVESVVNGLGGVLVLLMAAGALLAALDTGYAALEPRAQELATFRALGFSRRGLVIALLLESTCLSALGGALGAGLSALALDGLRASTLDFHAFTQMAFAFEVRAQASLQVAGCATAVGILGGLLPCVHALRRPVSAGLRL